MFEGEGVLGLEYLRVRVFRVGMFKSYVWVMVLEG